MTMHRVLKNIPISIFLLSTTNFLFGVEQTLSYYDQNRVCQWIEDITSTSNSSYSSADSDTDTNTVTRRMLPERTAKNVQNALRKEKQARRIQKLTQKLAVKRKQLEVMRTMLEKLS